MGEIAVILGRFGSGKTEFALNYAIKAADSGKKTVLADLDLVNPYFTSGLQAGLMERHNVKLIASIPTDEKVELQKTYIRFSARTGMCPCWTLAGTRSARESSGACLHSSRRPGKGQRPITL